MFYPSCVHITESGELRNWWVKNSDFLLELAAVVYNDGSDLLCCICVYSVQTWNEVLCYTPS